MKSFSRVPLLLMALSFAFPIAASAATLNLNWASTFSDVVGVANPGNMLGAPDAIAEPVYNGVDGDEETVTFSGFGSGDVTSTSSTALANALGISQALVDQSDFIAFDFQGVLAPFEQSRWTFSDGTDSLFVDHNFPFSTAVTGISAFGNLSAATYQSLFGVSPSNDLTAYILFDIAANSQVDVGLASFSARIDAGLIGGESPEIDALASITAVPVPIPAAFPLFAGGLVLLGLLGWRRKRMASAAA